MAAQGMAHHPVRGMIGHPRLTARIGTGLVALGIATAGLVLSAPAASAAACSGTSGVTVVVQSDAGTDVRCAPGDPGSATRALMNAGFSVTPVQQFPGAICQIGGYPDTSCVRMPPDTAYWAFYHAPAGGAWSYSNVGAGSYDPAPGSAVGFRFGSGGAPSVAPPAAPPPAPAPTTPAPPAPPPPPPTPAAPAPAPAAPAPAAGPRGSTSTTPRSGASGSTATPRAGGDSASPVASATPDPSATPGLATTADPSASPSNEGSIASSRMAPTAANSPSDGPGNIVGPIVGGVAIAALGAGAVLITRRRRAQGDASP